MKKSTVIAVVVFGLLAIAFLVTREKQVNVGVRKLTLQPVNAEAIVSVEIGGATPVSLRADNGSWTVAAATSTDKRFPADDGQVKTLLQALVEFKASDFVTEQPEKHAELEVDDAKGLTVKANTASGTVRDLVLGKASKSGGAYVRQAKSNEVFVTSSGLTHQAKRNVTAWRKKSIATVKAEDVTKVTITPAAGEPFSLIADSGGWKFEGKAPADYSFDSAAAQRVVSQLNSLTAQEFIDGDVIEPFNTVVAVEAKEGKTATLRLTAKRADGTYALKVDGNAQTYVLPAWQAEQLSKDADGLRDLRLMHFEVAQAERLTVISPGKKTVVVREGEKWKLAEPKTAADFDSAQVNTQLLRLASVRGLKKAQDVTELQAGINKPSVQIEVSLKGGGVQRLRFGGAGKNANEAFAKGDDGRVYVVASHDKASFETGAELFKRPPPPPDMNGVQGLDQLPPEIRKQIEAQLRQQQH